MTPHASAQGTVIIHLPGKQQILSVSPMENIIQLAAQPQLHDRLWWPDALLTDSATKAKALKGYQYAMAQFASREAGVDDGVAATIESVHQQLLNLDITDRLSVKLDLDSIRVDENSNPPLVRDYIFYTIQCPVTITLLGVAFGVGRLPWQAGRSVTDYLQDYPRLTDVDKSNVMVIMPEGRTTVAPVALRNRKYVGPPPDSQPWLGFSARILSEKYADLNDQVVPVSTRHVPD